MIYSSSAPVRPDSIDNEQYSTLNKFKESLRTKGLFEQYESLSDFRMKFARQLAQRVILGFASGLLPASVVVLPLRQPIPSIGPEARELLIEASKDRQGVIMSLQTMEGASVQTNGRD